MLIDTQPTLPLFRYFLDALDRPEMWSFRDQEHVGAISAVRARVLAGRGIAVLPEYFVAPDLASGALVRLLPDVELQSDWFRMVWRADDPREAEMGELADSLRRIPLA